MSISLDSLANIIIGLIILRILAIRSDIEINS